MFLFLLAGPLAWAMHLMLLYGLHALICAGGGDAGAMRALGSGITALALAVAAAPIAAPLATSRLFGLERGPDRSFHREAARLLAVLSALGIAWGGAMIFLFPACALLR